MKNEEIEKISRKMDDLIVIAKTLTGIRIEKESNDIFNQALKLNRVFNNAIKRNNATGYGSVAKKIDDLGRKMNDLKERRKVLKKRR